MVEGLSVKQQDCLIYADIVCDYIPGISTVNNIFIIYIKIINFINDKSSDKINKNIYYSKYIEDKNVFRSLTLIVPILGNLMILIYDLTHLEYCQKSYILEHSDQFKKASYRLKNDPDFSKKILLKHNKYSYGQYGQKCWDDKDFVLWAIKNEELLSHWDDLPEEIENNNEFTSNAFWRASPLLKEDREVILAAVEKYPETFKKLDERFRKDPDIAEAAISADPKMLCHAAQDIKNNSKIVKIAVSKDVQMLQQASKELINNFDFLKDLFLFDYNEKSCLAPINHTSANYNLDFKKHYEEKENNNRVLLSLVGKGVTDELIKMNNKNNKIIQGYRNTLYFSN